MREVPCSSLLLSHPQQTTRQEMHSWRVEVLCSFHSYFRDIPGTSQRSASPLLSAILPWRLLLKAACKVNGTTFCMSCPSYRFLPSQHRPRRRSINTMSSFILHCYIRYWFTSPSLTGAASNDLKMYQDLTTFKRVSKAVSDACLPVLQRHTWYLTEEYIPISLCNPALETETCNQLDRKIGLVCFNVMVKQTKIPLW